MDIVETVQSLNVEQGSNFQSHQIIKTTKLQKPQSTSTQNISENNTTITNINFLSKNLNEPNPNILNMQIPKDTISISTGTSSNNCQQDTISTNSSKKNFMNKTKEWAGNMWNSLKSIKFKKMFAKQEFKEYRNANGDIVKIPVNKIALKKKKEMNENVKKMISEEQNKNINDYYSASKGLYSFY